MLSFLRYQKFLILFLTVLGDRYHVLLNLMKTLYNNKYGTFLSLGTSIFNSISETKHRAQMITANQ